MQLSFSCQLDEGPGTGEEGGVERAGRAGAFAGLGDSGCWIIEQYWTP